MTTTAPFKPLTKEDVADALGISLRTVENWVNEGTLLPPKRIGNRVYWHPSTFYTWLDQCLGESVADATSTPAAQGGNEAGRAKATPRKKDAKEAKTELASLRNRSNAKLTALLGQ